MLSWDARENTCAKICLSFNDQKRKGHKGGSEGGGQGVTIRKTESFVNLVFHICLF